MIHVGEIAGKLVGVRRWNGSFAASPAASVGASRLGVNFRPLPPEGIQAFISGCY